MVVRRINRVSGWVFVGLGLLAVTACGGRAAVEVSAPSGAGAAQSTTVVTVPRTTTSSTVPVPVVTALPPATVLPTATVPPTNTAPVRNRPKPPSARPVQGRVATGAGGSGPLPTPTQPPVAATPRAAVDPGLGFVPMPFLAVTTRSDSDRLKALLDRAGVPGQAPWGPCTTVDVMGWDPGRGDVDLFVGYDGGSCGGDAMEVFFSVRAGAVAVLAQTCGDCVTGSGSDADRYRAIDQRMIGGPAMTAAIRGGPAGWDFATFSRTVR